MTDEHDTDEHDDWHALGTVIVDAGHLATFEPHHGLDLDWLFVLGLAAMRRVTLNLDDLTDPSLVNVHLDGDNADEPPPAVPLNNVVTIEGRFGPDRRVHEIRIRFSYDDADGLPSRHLRIVEAS
jgi:hypothetical protein